MDTNNIIAIESALRLIREVCNDNDLCEKCPLRSYEVTTKQGFERCMVRKDQPYKWVLASDYLGTVTPRIFK